MVAVLIELALLRLGFWQLNRAQEKQTQQQQASEVLKKRQAIALQGFDPTSRRIEWAQGELRFLPDPLVLLDNQRREQEVGVIVYQLAELSDGQVLLVDLGWLPVPGNRQLPKPRTLEGLLSVQGLLLLPPSKGLAMGPAFTDQADGTVLLTRFDIKALSNRFNKSLPERVLRLDPDLPIGFSRDLAIQVNTLTPEKHRGYAMQWFGLAAAFAVLCFGFWRRKK